MHILNLFARVPGQVWHWQFYNDVHYRNPDITVNGLDSFAPYSALIERAQATKTVRPH